MAVTIQIAWSGQIPVSTVCALNQALSTPAPTSASPATQRNQVREAPCSEDRVILLAQVHDSEWEDCLKSFTSAARSMFINDPTRTLFEMN